MSSKQINRLENFLGKTFRYLVSGGAAFSFDLFCLYVLADLLKIWYLVSSIAAFILAFFLGFSLHKFWTFKNKDITILHKQLGVYFTVTLANLGVNTLLIFSFVDFLKINYLIAQIVSSLLIALYSFFLYQYFIFKKGRGDRTQESELLSDESIL